MQNAGIEGIDPWAITNSPDLIRIALPPMNTEPDRGVREDDFPFKGDPCQVPC